MVQAALRGFINRNEFRAPKPSIHDDDDDIRIYDQYDILLN